MKYSLCYTSRRAASILPAITSWIERSKWPENVEVILSTDSDYLEGKQAAEQAANEFPLLFTWVENTGPSTCVSGWNTAATKATGDVLIAITDDFLPPEEWDAELQNVAKGEPWWQGDHVVWIADGYNPDILTLSILTRRRYQRFGYIFYPGYASLFCDTEFGAVAHSEGIVIDARHLLFEHMHPDCGKRTRDAVDLVHASKQRWDEGEMLFKFRKESGFPVDAGPVAERLETVYNEEHMRFAAYVQAIRNDFCLLEVLNRIAEEVNAVFPPGIGAPPRLAVYVAMPDEYWSGKPQEEWQREEVLDAVEQFCNVHPDVPVHVFSQHVAPHRGPGRNRIVVETAVRNAALERIRGDGFVHTLVLDGDELWDPGLFRRLVDFVRERQPHSVYTGMIPVIGLPGYPVQGALDKATIYVGPSSWFVDCRGVSGHRHELVSYSVVHFTATRRTREEIAQKMLDSGHADDPLYDFKAWNAHVLPNIRPGFKHRFSPKSNGLHMYTQYNVWPDCREWTAEEWSRLPETIKKYLAAPKP